MKKTPQKNNSHSAAQPKIVVAQRIVILLTPIIVLGNQLAVYSTDDNAFGWGILTQALLFGLLTVFVALFSIHAVLVMLKKQKLDVLSLVPYIGILVFLFVNILD